MSDLFVWQKNLLHAVKTFDVIILHGNIRDLYVYTDRAAQSIYYEVKLDELLTRLLFPSVGTIRRYDPYAKVSDLSLGDASTFVSTNVEGFGDTGFRSFIEQTATEILNDVEKPTPKCFWLLKNMHNLLPFRSSYSEEEGLRLVVFQRMIENLAPGNKLMLCYLSDTQVPIEISGNAHRVTFVKVPLPEFDERLVFWSQFLFGRSIDLNKDQKDSATALSKLTEGLAITQMRNLIILATQDADARKIEQDKLTLRDWERALRHYKFGESKNYYQQITTENLNTAKEFFTEKEGIKGQDFAVTKTIEMLYKARTNVASLLRSGPSSAPRGTLFLCGPSGTGKTMLSKKLAKFVFSSEEAFHRIDMSEYQQDHTVSKLIGSPPGYVGFEMGGILTNAMLQKPFSVILFDEIEKAHPRIFDLFLQILSDGRLTDSRGQAVFFSEAIIVFTSNIGTRSNEIKSLKKAQQSENPKESIHNHFVECVEKFFRTEISRPELLNRIGNNIIPFAYLDQDEVLISTVEFYLKGLIERFNDEYREHDLRLAIDLPTVATFFVKEEHGRKLREFGGRAVLNAIDDLVLPLLAQHLVSLVGNESHDNEPRDPIELRVGVITTDKERKIHVRKA